MLRFGPTGGPLVVVAPALFEEGNRTRAFLVLILRLLAEHGIGSVLPDLPGQGESLVALGSVQRMDWMEAFEAAWNATVASAHAVGTVSIRGGGLVDTLALAPGRWQLAPMTGEDLVKDLWRIRQLADGRGRQADFESFRSADQVEIAGLRMSGELLSGLYCAEPFTHDLGVPLRVVRLETDPRPADLKLPGRPLWRASEPDVDEPLARALADDIDAWVRTCAA